jgi:hypothetical protein
MAQKGKGKTEPSSSAAVKRRATGVERVFSDSLDALKRGVRRWRKTVLQDALMRVVAGRDRASV